MATHFIVVIMSVMFLIAAQEYGDTVMMTISLKLVIYQKGFNIERLTNTWKRKKKLWYNQQMYCLLFISEQAIWQNTALIFQEFKTMSKITHMKKLIEYQDVFRSDLRLDKKLVMEYKQVFLISNMSFKIILKILYWVNKRENRFGCMVMDWRNCSLWILCKNIKKWAKHQKTWHI